MAEDWVDETAARVMAVIDDFKSKTEWPVMFEFMLAKAVSDLRIKIAEAERTIAELKAAEATWRMAKTEAQSHADRMQAERDEAKTAIEDLRVAHGLNVEALQSSIDNCAQRVQKLGAERDEARRVAVWTLDEAQDGRLSLWQRCISFRRRRDGVIIDCGHDGTDEDRYSALRRAMGESE